MRNEDGSPRIAYRNWGKKIFSWILRIPEVLEHLRDLDCLDKEIWF